MGRKHNKTRRKTKKDKKKQRKAKIGKNTSKWARVQMKQIANFKKNKAAKTKTRKKNKGGRHHAHPTGLGDGDNRKIDQYLAEERIRDLQIQDPSVLAESEAIARGDVAAIDRRDAHIEDMRQRLAALNAQLAPPDDDEPPTLDELRRRLRATALPPPPPTFTPVIAGSATRARAAAARNIPTAVRVPIDVRTRAPIVSAAELAAANVDLGRLPTAPRAGGGRRRRRKTRKRRRKRRRRTRKRKN